MSIEISGARSLLFLFRTRVTLQVTWNDLGFFGARLIATTKKNAKGESVCSKTFRPWRLLAPGFFVLQAPIAGCWRNACASGLNLRPRARLCRVAKERWFPSPLP